VKLVDRRGVSPEIGCELRVVSCGLSVKRKNGLRVVRCGFRLFHSPFATRHSLFAIRYSPVAIRHSPLTIRYSPFATRCRLPICRFHDLPISSARQEPRHPEFSAVREHCPPETANSASQESSHSILNHHGNRLSLGGYQITSPTTGSPKTPSSS